MTLIYFPKCTNPISLTYEILRTATFRWKSRSVIAWSFPFEQSEYSHPFLPPIVGPIDDPMESGGE